jgi:transcriptional regulator with XRE-family HTH domain
MGRSRTQREEEIAYRESIARQSVEEVADATSPAVKNGTAWAIELIMHAIRQERSRQGLSLDALSERTGIDKAMLSRLENGKLLNTQVDTLMRLALALGKSIGLELIEPRRPASRSNLDVAGVEQHLARKAGSRGKTPAITGA